METSFLSTVILPIGLAIIMLGLGLSLTVADFRRAATARRAVLVALSCQILVMPAICVVLVTVIDAEPTLAVGMLLLAASPGGTLAAFYSKLAGGDVALNITLTAINSVLSVITLPLVVWAATSHYFGDGNYIGLQPDAVTKIVAIVLLPVAFGMLVRRLRPVLADALHKPVRVVSLVVLVAVIVGAIVENRERLADTLATVAPVAAVFCVLNLSIGYWLPKLFRLPRPQSIATSTEIGVHNSALAITIAVSPDLLNNPAVSLAPAIYVLVSLTATGVFVYLLSRVRVA